jgi:PAS domain S-box-containing protein
MITNASRLVNKHATSSDFMENGKTLTNCEEFNSFKPLRYSGIELIGNIPWGTHFCQFYQTKQDILDILVPYFKFGLESNELCVWVTSDFLGQEEALIALNDAMPNFTEYLQKGQIEILPYTDWYVKGGKFEMERVLNQWITKHNNAINKGYDGLRVSGNPIWIDNMKDWDDFTAYEEEINTVIDEFNILVLCTYSLEKCDVNKVADVVINHQFTLIKRSDNWKLIESAAHKKTVKAHRRNLHQAYLINHVSDAIIASDKNFYITFWNKAAEKVYGWKAEEALGKKGNELLRTEFIDISREQALKLAEEQGSYKSDLIHYHKDGYAIHIESFFSPITDEQGQVTEYVSVNRDITERTKLEKEIKTLAKFPAENPNPVMRVSYDGKIQYANEASNEILQNWNCSVGDLIPEIWLNEIRASFGSNTHKIIAIESPQKVYSFVIAAVREEDYANLYGRDITEAKKFEEALKQSEQNFRNILDATQESIYLFDRQSHIIAANAMAIKRLSLPMKEVIGRHFSAFMSPELFSLRHKQLETVFTTGKPVYFEDERNGMHFEHHFFPCFNEDKVMYVASYSRDITEKRKIEATLLESEEKYRELVENANTIILKMDTSGKFTYINEYGQKFFGFEAQEIIGKTPFETIVPAIETTGRDLKEMMDNIYDDPDKFVINLNENVKKNGELVWVEWHNKSLLDKKGNRLGHLSIGTDITERINAVNALQKNNLRLELLSDIASRLLASKSPQDIVNELCNKVMYFLDCHTFFNFIVDDVAEKLHLNTFAGIPDETARDIEWLDFGVAVCGCVARDGTRIIAENIPETPDIRTELIKSFGVKAYACHPLYSQGKVIGTLSFGTKSRTHFSEEDIALMKAVADQVAIAMSRVMAEKKLEESQEKLTLALENGSIGVWAWDITTNEIEWDERMEKMFGVQPGSFGKNYDAFEDFLVDEDVTHVRNAIQRTLEEDVPFETVYRIRVNDGDIKYINAKALVTKDKEDKPIKMSGVCFDITEMKRGAEQALFKTNEELLRSNKELEQFAYVASHDLQEPLRMVSSFTQLLAKRYMDKLDKDANDFIQFAVDGALRMQTLINDLLSYSRVNTRGKDFTQFDMHTALEQAIYNLQLDIKEKQALITYDELSVIKADEAQIVQLLQNLIGNAIKFCNGLPKVHISAKEEKDYYIFSVQDNGIGIEAQYFDRIFQIFQRLQPRETYAGTGIGLAICKRIIDRHKGKIWLESEINKGTIFYFQIPK